MKSSRRRYCSRWIEDLRLVTTDPFAQRKAIDHVYAHLAMGSEAQAFVTAFYRGRPAAEAGTDTNRQYRCEIRSAQQQPDL